MAGEAQGCRAETRDGGEARGQREGELHSQGEGNRRRKLEARLRGDAEGFL